MNLGILNIVVPTIKISQVYASGEKNQNFLSIICIEFIFQQKFYILFSFLSLSLLESFSSTPATLCSFISLWPYAQEFTDLVTVSLYFRNQEPKN